MQNDTITGASVRTQTTQAEIACLYLELNEDSRALMLRLLRAVVAKDTEALETLKAESPKACTPILNGFIADIQKGVKL